MKTGGWIFLIISWGVILGICVFCFRFIFAKHAEEHLVAPMEIESEWEEEEEEAKESGQPTPPPHHHDRED